MKYITTELSLRYLSNFNLIFNYNYPFIYSSKATQYFKDIIYNGFTSNMRGKYTLYNTFIKYFLLIILKRTHYPFHDSRGRK